MNTKMTRDQIKKIVRLTESIVNKRLNESNDIEKWLNQDSDYGIIKSVTKNKRNNKQVKITSTDYPNGIYLEYDGWGNWVEIDKPLNFNESIVNKKLNEVTTVNSPKELVTHLLKTNPRFKWLIDDLGSGYSFKDIEIALSDAGYSKVYSNYKINETYRGKRLNESSSDPYADSWIPYKNLNGDSENTIIKDYIKIIQSCDALIQTIAAADSLYHGRNSINPKHQSRMLEFKKLNIAEIRSIYETYINSLKDFQQLNKLG